jgi:glycosyltransferase involved in cell wall biosynthesis
MNNQIELSIVMPCLNEAETLAVCIQKAQMFLERYQVCGEVIVADNGSTDGSQKIALSHGARVININAKGYGAALMGGIINAHGRYIIMGDSDDSYDFLSLASYVEKLREGYDLVMGNRFRGGVKEGAMPFLHKYLGNPVLSFIGRLFFDSPIGDFHCGLRGFSKEAVKKMDLRTTGMEFASEMVVKASLMGMKITEVPTTLSPDGRSRPPHLRTWRDGWRHLRFLLMYSPKWLFLYPGFFLMIVGLVVSAILTLQPIYLFGVRLDVHTLLYTASCIIIGFQGVVFYLFTKIFAIREGLLPEDKTLSSLYKFVTLESGLLVGSVLTIIGLILTMYAFQDWNQAGFAGLNPSITLRKVIPAVTSLIIGIQLILYSFFLSILGLRQ